jgi:hypothetical protein
VGSNDRTWFPASDIRHSYLKAYAGRSALMTPVLTYIGLARAFDFRLTPSAAAITRSKADVPKPHAYVCASGA